MMIPIKLVKRTEGEQKAYAEGYSAGKRDAVRHGRWIIDEWDTPNCSVCGCSGIDDYYATPYCPHCGASMDEVKE